MTAPPGHPRARARAQARQRAIELQASVRAARERLTTAMRCGPYAAEAELRGVYDALCADLERAKREARR